MESAAASRDPSPGETSLVQRASSAIMDLIRTRNLKIGDSLPSEGALALQLGVSKVVVREANRALAALGVIEIINGRPARVGRPSQDVLKVLIGHALQTQHATIQQVMDVRRTLETRIVTLAAVRRTPAQAAAIRELAAAMEAAFDDPPAMMRHDIAFHMALAEASHNPLLALFMGAFEQVTEMTWPVTWRTRGSESARRDVVAVHLEVAEAIEAQDCARAERAIARHFDDTVLTLVTAGLV
jgi:GntR family transcriptional repressor for pyruvate dehydrogenase complex